MKNNHWARREEGEEELGCGLSTLHSHSAQVEQHRESKHWWISAKGLKGEIAQLRANMARILETNDVSNMVPNMQKINLICFSRE